MAMTDVPLVAAFRAERYAPAVWLTAVLAPPYDVIDTAERETLAARDAHNVVHVILPEGNGDRYAHAALLLEQWRGAGALVTDQVPGVYVVRQRFSTGDGAAHERTGVIAAVAAEPFAAGRVRPHEHTHAGPKQDRLELLRATETMCEALLMLSRDSTSALRHQLLDVTRAAPTARARLADVEIALWAVHGEAAEALARAASREPLYIADGHHRYETTVAYQRENARAARTLALIVPLGDPGLVVLPTHRLVAGRPVPDDVLNALAGHCTIEPLRDAADVVPSLDTVRGRGCVVLLGSGRAFRLTRNGATPPALAAQAEAVRSLDVAWADEAVVPTLKATAGAETLAYTPDAAAAVDTVRRGDASAAVLLAPPAVEQVLDVADAGAFMPPKATFFTPKVPSGIVFLHYTDAA
jgi:uncharacterized protein (DUF1015 family)